MLESPRLLRVVLISEDETQWVEWRRLLDLHGEGRFVVEVSAGTIGDVLALSRLSQADVALLSLGAAMEPAALENLCDAAPDLSLVVVGTPASARHPAIADYLPIPLDGRILARGLRYAVEKHRAEEALEHERGLLGTLLENVPDRIYFKDRESRFIRINYALTHLLGLESAEEAYGKTDFDFYDAKHAREAREDEERVMRTGDPLIGKVEHEVLGSRRESWSLTTKIPLKNKRGEIVGTCGISREITAIKELEIALAAERNLLRGIMDNLPDAIFLKDKKGRYLMDNAAHWKSLGATGPSEVRGKTVFDYFPHDLATMFHEHDLQVLTTGAAFLDHEEESLTPTGRRQCRLSTKVPWKDDEGNTLGVLCITRDITEQKEAAEKLQAANAELERRGQALQKALGELQEAHLQLREMQVQIVEAEKMKTVGRLSAGVAHEVKNPLAVLRMGLEFLRSCNFDDGVGSVLREMTDAVNRADAVVRGLLDYSAPQRLELGSVDLNRLVENAVSLVRGEASATVDVILELDRTIPAIALDEVKISQVVVNLLTNALHAMELGGTLTVRTYLKQLTGVGANIADFRSEQFRVGQGLVVLEVDDTGHGIAEDKLPKIFEPFFTTKPTGRGTGLGLSVVKTIVELHGGTIDIRNLPMGGVRVTVMLRA